MGEKTSRKIPGDSVSPWKSPCMMGDPFLALKVCCHFPVAVLDVVGDFLRDSNQLDHVFTSRKVIETGSLSSRA